MFLSAYHPLFFVDLYVYNVASKPFFKGKVRVKCHRERCQMASSQGYPLSELSLPVGGVTRGPKAGGTARGWTP